MLRSLAGNMCALPSHVESFFGGARVTSTLARNALRQQCCSTGLTEPASSRSLRSISREHRRWNQGKAEWWAERTFRFGRGGSEAQAVLSYEIVTPFQMNQYLLGCPRTGKAAIIDTGCASASLEAAKNLGLEIKYLLQTHAHIDHISGLAKIKDLIDAPIYLHPSDLPWYEAADRQVEMFGIPLDPPPPVDVHLQDGDILSIGEIELQVLHTPGHCPGHVCFYNEQHGFLIGGDLLFRGSVGRTDFPLSDPAAMKASLRKVMLLPDETKVFAGHMEPTSIGHERRRNPFVKQALG